MANPKFGVDGMDAASVAVVGGQGEGTARTVLPVTSADYDVTANNIEFFVNATDVETTDGLTARGNKALAEKKIKDYFTFEVLQTPTCQYGVHYFLGDLGKRYQSLYAG